MHLGPVHLLFALHTVVLHFSSPLPAPKLSLECSVDLLFLVDSSSGTSLEGFLRYKAFLKRFVQAVLSRDTPAKVGVAQYSNNVTVPIAMGAYEDVHGLVRSIDAMHFTGGETLTGRALRYIAQHGFKSASAFTDIRVELPRVVALFTDSESQDSVAEAAKHTRDQGVFLIGVGSEFLRAELDGITGSPKQTIVYSNPQDLFNKIPELQKTICSVDRPPGKAGVAPWGSHERSSGSEAPGVRNRAFKKHISLPLEAK